MKKYMVVMSAIIMTASVVNYAMTDTQLGDYYEKGIEQTFFKYSHDADSFYFFLEETMTPMMISWCTKAAKEIKSFVEGHSKNLMGMKDSLLNNTATEFEKLTLDTINSIKVARIVTTAGKITREGLLQQSNVFEKGLKVRCANLIEKLQKESFNIAEKKQSKELLLRVLNVLQNLIKIAQDSLQYAVSHT